MRYRNKNILKGLEYIFSLSPDVICLQEVPQHVLRYLSKTKQKHYHLDYVTDFVSFNETKNSYTCTLTCQRPTSHKVIKHGPDNYGSLLSKFYYQLLNQTTEQHATLKTDIQVQGKKYTILNTRLSCAVSPRLRLHFLQNIFQCLKQDLRHQNRQIIFCGDFNISGNLIFNVLTGWTRGYKFKDYFYRERKTAELFFTAEALRNVFTKQMTTVFKLAGLQLDHILVHLDEEITNYHLLQRFGSDHCVLFLETV